MKTVTTIGIDLAKNSFSIYGVNTKGSITLLIHGARAALSRMVSGYTPEYRRNLWAMELAARRGKNRASVALANKTARVVWSMLTQGTEYRLRRNIAFVMPLAARLHCV